MESSTIATVRDIFVIVAAGVLAAAGITAIVLVIKLFKPLREIVENTAVSSRNLRKLSGDLTAVSEETAGNVAQTSRNAVTISENLKESSEELPEAVRNARDAAGKVAEAASQVGTIAGTVSRFSSLGVSGGSGSSSGSGVGTLLRMLRTMFGGGRRGDDSGAQQGA